MKKILSIIILLEFMSAALYSQEMLTQQEIDSIIASIGHTKIWEWGEPLGALNKVRKYQLKEALPAIEDNYWKHSDPVQWVSLMILQEFKSAKFREIAHKTIDSADVMSKRRRDNRLGAKKMRLYATDCLIKDGDFSTAQYIFDPEAKDIMLHYVEAVSLVLKNVPAYREECKAALINVLHTDSSYFDPRDALTALVDAFGTEIFPELVWAFKYHSPSDGRISLTALEYLTSLKYPGLDALLRELLLTQANKTYNHVFLELLIKEFGTPSDYKFVATYCDQQAEPHFEGVLIRSFLFREFIPPKPDSSTSIETMLDSLISYKHQCYTYTWLGDQNFVKELDNHLTNAKKHFEKKDSIETAYEIGKFQSKISKEYKEGNIGDNRFVTIEGWKFLYYNAQYIIERLVTLPPKATGTVLKQIDNLKTELQNQSEKKNIGGALFVKGLTLLIDKAKKELQKADSSETALYIALFQLVVDETWELTQKLEEKNKKFAALYVLDEAYIALHHRAEYILEALPEPRRSAHEQRQQILEKDPSFREMQQELEKMEKSMEEK
jgi:hypothetical protein